MPVRGATRRNPDDPILPRPLAGRVLAEPPTARTNGHPPEPDAEPEPWDFWAEEERARLVEAARDEATEMLKGRPEPKREALTAFPETPDLEAWVAELAANSRRPEAVENYALTLPGTKGRTDRLKKAGRTLPAIAADLARLTRADFGGEGWPRRVGDLLFDAGADLEPVWLPTVEALFAWLGRFVPVRWASLDDAPTKAEFAAYLRMSVRSYEAVEALPHYPPLPRHYYAHPEPAGGDGEALDELVERFCPATPTDAALIRAAFLTPFWGGEPGSRPAYLIESADDGDGGGGRGTGKTTLAKAVARVAGGHIDLRPGEDLGRMMSRLLTPGSLTRRVALLDNVKTLRFSWADLEGLITNDSINGYQLYVGDARRPNTLTWLLTLNGANLSKDLAQRCVIVRLRRPPNDPAWEKDTWAFIDANRWAIIGDALAALRAEGAPLAGYSRWSLWEEGVLSRCPDPDGCRKVIAERAAEVDGDAEEAALVREAFVTALKARGYDPESEVVFVPSADAAAIVNAATGESRPTQRATTYLLTLAIRELRKSNATDGARGWRWTPKGAESGAPAVRLRSGAEVADAKLAGVKASLEAKKARGRAKLAARKRRAEADD